MKTTLALPSLRDTRFLANVLAETLVAGDTVLLSGPVGAGKTELARMFIQTRLQEIGTIEDVPSPTFTLVQTYDLHDTQIWHADLYRLTLIDELYELGLDQAFEDSICLIEWPERLGSLRPVSALSLTFEILDDEQRRVSLEWSDSKWDSMISVLSYLNKTQGQTDLTDRSQLITRFLNDAGWGGATRANLAGDASNRSYDRLHDVTLGAAVLMNAPPDKGEDIRPFVKMTNWLLDAGVSAPRILAADDAAGLLLLEDFGDDLYARLCAKEPSLELPLYLAAVDVLVHLAKAPPPAKIAPYDSATYLRETQLLTGWYLPATTGQDTSPDLQAEFNDLITKACAGLAETTVILRDYHSENLLWLPDRVGIKRVGQLDYQDALLGHPAYDLVSLLEDARRDTSLELQDAMFDHYVAQSGVDRAAFRQAYNVLGMQRNIKIIGIFARLCRRDGKPAYLKHMPRVWSHLQRDLTDPALGAMKDWVARHVPEPTPAVMARIAGSHP